MTRIINFGRNVEFEPRRAYEPEDESAWWYSISFTTYVEPRDEFYRVASFLAKALLVLYVGRIHWGKWFLLETKDIEQLYPNWERFRDICREFDPRDVFQPKVAATRRVPSA